MSILSYVVVFSLLGGVVSLIGGLLLLRSNKTASALARYATPFAGGALLAAVFLDLLREGVEVDAPETVLTAALVGMVVFFLAEGFLQWFHHHHEHADSKRDPKTWLIIVGDTMHNALDGVAIAASFLISIPTGIVTTIAVAAHEIPQEIGDFGLLLSKGMRRRNVLLVNLLSAFATVVFAVITYLLGSEEQLPVGVLLGLSAGFLLYIAASDIIPAIHERSTKRRVFDIQALLLVLGVVVVGLVTTVAHQYIDAGHDHEKSPSQSQEHSEEETHQD
jgi:zinc and cadmium transporter